VIIAGLDEKEGPSIYAVQPSGAAIKQDYALGGSGSGFIFAYVDANFKPNMSLEEAKNLLKKSVSLAMSRDGSSGGIIRILNVTPQSVTREYITHTELPYRFP